MQRYLWLIPAEEKPEFPVHLVVQVINKSTLLHRSKMDIIDNILQAANDGGAKKTHIMYKCNLSFKQLHAYLELLVEMGLLKPVSLVTETNEKLLLFETTKKGQAFIKAYDNLSALLVTK
jgi:predicted transcriptional regulator